MDPFRPNIGLLVKIGSLVVHADEFTSPSSYDCDRLAIRSGLEDPAVKEWVEQMTKLGFLPVKR